MTSIRSIIKKKQDEKPLKAPICESNDINSSDASDNTILFLTIKSPNLTTNEKIELINTLSSKQIDAFLADQKLQVRISFLISLFTDSEIPDELLATIMLRASREGLAKAVKLQTSLGTTIFHVVDSISYPKAYAALMSQISHDLEDGFSIMNTSMGEKLTQNLDESYVSGSNHTSSTDVKSDLKQNEAQKNLDAFLGNSARPSTAMHSDVEIGSGKLLTTNNTPLDKVAIDEKYFPLPAKGDKMMSGIIPKKVVKPTALSSLMGLFASTAQSKDTIVSNTEHQAETYSGRNAYDP